MSDPYFAIGKLLDSLPPEAAVPLRDWIAGLEEERDDWRDRANDISSKLHSAEMFVREIVAWFDVVQQKYDLYDGTVADEWPKDWLRRVRETISGTGVENKVS